MGFDIQAIIEASPYLLRGLSNTILLTVLAILLSTIAAIICAILRISKISFLRWSLIIYIEIFRNTPIVAQIFFLYFALPLLGFKISAFGCGIIALVLHFTAYNIEVFRGGMELVPYTVHEAGKSLGFTHVQQLIFIILPLAIRFSLPALTNHFVSTCKQTAMVSIIGVSELTFVATDVVANDFVFLEMYTTISAIYLVLVFGLSWILRELEKRFAIPM